MAAFFKRIFTKPLPVAAVCLLIVGISVAAVWKFHFFDNQTKRALASLNKAYNQKRPFEPRISGFSYAPIAETRGGAAAQTEIDKIELDRAENILIGAAENPTAENLHALGRFFLTKKDFEMAIEQLQKALNLAPDDPKIHNDLGIAWLEKGKLENAGNENSRSLEFYAKGFEEFEKAREADDSLAEVFFNRALCLQSMNLPTETREAWRAYLNLDAVSPWSREADKNLENLDLQPENVSRKTDELLQEFLEVSQSKADEKAWLMLSRNREMISGGLIPQQLAAAYSNTRKKEYLDALLYAGNIEAAQTGDSYWKGVAGFYSRLSGDKIANLARAQAFVAKGYELCLAGNYGGALPQFQQARKIFDENADVLEANLAAYWVGYCDYVTVKLTESKRELETLAEYCGARNYRWLEAHALFWAGVNYGSENQSSKAIDYYKKAFQAAESVSDFYNSQKILTETAEEYRLVGRADLSLEYLQKSLALSNYPESSLRQRSRTYNILVRTFCSLKSYAAALAFERETILLLEQIKDTAFELASNIQMGQILEARKDYDAAFKVFEESRKNAEAIENEGRRKGRLAFLTLQIAHLERETGACEKALPDYDAAINFYDASEYKAERYDAHKGRLFCYQIEEDAQNFETELGTVLEIFENNRAAILDEQTRNVFFGGEQNVYDIAIDYEYGRGNLEKAFDYSERSRSRSLLDLLKNGASVEKSGGKLEVKIKTVSAPLGVEEIRAQMPEAVQIVEYTILKNKILIWLVSKTDFQVFTSDISDENLRAKAGSYLKLVSTNDESRADERQRLAGELYQILIKPFIDKTGDGKTICLIPDKSLFQLPFAALVSPENGQYFIAERNFFFAPSANLFLALTKNAEKFGGGNSAEKVLSIGNPTFDRKEFPNLQNLSAAGREASEIARVYQSSVVLLEKDATKTAVGENLPRADVIHFAGHYVIDERAPLRSGFVLSGDKQKNDGNLANYELIGANLPRAKLVVLSACQTGIENFYNGEGMIGAARTFLAAGIPLVVGSLWSVDSDATAELMISFHKYRKTENLSTVDALRRAQLDLINGRNERLKNPYYWSAFVTLGGYSEF